MPLFSTADELLGDNNFQRCETSGEGVRRDNTCRDMVFQRALKPYAKIRFTGITCSIEKPLRQAIQGVKQTVI